ncbi:MAG: permease [Alphaproteobacteria bacterium]|nr:permease [Alphaproteobacteria bacterium]
MNAEKLVPAALGLLAFCVAAETLQQLSFKLGNARAEQTPSFAWGVALQPLIWLGLVLWVVESIAWVLVLQKTPLSMAYPVMTVTYATVPVAGLLLLKEKMSRRQTLGAALILAGVVIVGVAGV